MVPAERRQEQAKQQTQEATRVLTQLRSILKEAARSDPQRGIETLKDSSRFSEPKPQPPRKPTRPPKPRDRRPPNPNDSRYQVSLGLLDRLSAERRRRKVNDARSRFEKGYQT